VTSRLLLMLSVALLGAGLWILTGACAFALTSMPPPDQVGAYRSAFYQRALFGVGCLMAAIVLLRARRGSQPRGTGTDAEHPSS
jgi:hypothetical protein